MSASDPVAVVVEPTSNTIASPSERTALVSIPKLKPSYFFYKVKRKRTEDATDICEIEKDGVISAVTAVKSSSVFSGSFRPHEDHKTAIHFVCTIVEPFGEEILTLTGYQNFICCGSSVFAKFTKGRQLLGSIEFNNNSAYIVKGKNSETIFSLVGPSRFDLICLPCCLVSSTMEFTMLNPDGSELGKIGNKWNENIPYKTGNQYGVCIPSDLDLEKQLLVLGSSLLIRWQFWRPFNNGFWCLTPVAFALLVTAAICIAVFIAYKFGTE